MVIMYKIRLPSSTNLQLDDLPVIKEQVRKGFQETQSKFNNFLTTIKKKIDGDDEGGFQSPPPRAATGYRIPQQQQSPYRGRRSSEMGRRSADRERYDADPQVLGDDFTGLNLRDDESKPRVHLTSFSNQSLITFQPLNAALPAP